MRRNGINMNKLKLMTVIGTRPEIIRLSEETNRRIVDHIAYVNLCYSEHARRYLNAEGTAKERTYVTGSPMAEVLSANMDKILASNVLETLGLEKDNYILLSAHREENIDDERNFFCVNGSSQQYGGNIKIVKWEQIDVITAG